MSTSTHGVTDINSATSRNENLHSHKANENRSDPQIQSSWLPTVNASLLEGLRTYLNIENPNQVQVEACKPIYDGRSVMLRAETGSGKTLAYMIPLLQQIFDRGFPPFRTLVLVPTRELAVQVYNVAIQLLEPSQGSKATTRVNCVGKGLLGEKKQLRRLLRDNPSMVIGTPKQLFELGSKEPILEQFETVVLDEIDFMLNPLKANATEKQRKRRAKHPKPASLILDQIVFRRQLDMFESRDALLPLRRDIQLVGVSATLGQPVRRELVHKRWISSDMEVIKVSHSSSRLPQGLKHYVVTEHFDVEQWEPEMEAQSTMLSPDTLTDLVLSVVAHQGASSVLLFVPSSVSIDDTVSMLRTQSMLPADPSLPPRPIRAEALYTHVHGVKPADAQLKRAAIVNRIAQSTAEQPYIIVLNMDTARGLDLPGVEMALLVGTPRTPSDYQHIAGRVGRAGQQGQVVTVAYDVKQTLRVKKMTETLNVPLLPLATKTA
eukprot:TRINITY_DN12257_c4_g3_i2.p1 TRINITY_DN12257_c4_g3~~TRINITY_DN12257_c4_g3_i2.p1  ORF type:complete len:534 (+),score=75.94 TRINITY_DN12257_c4_g3_i2:130-1602(+)